MWSLRPFGRFSAPQKRPPDSADKAKITPGPIQIDQNRRFSLQQGRPAVFYCSTGFFRAALQISSYAEIRIIPQCLQTIGMLNFGHSGGSTDMKATGIVRRIDDLGRVVIPKEIRRTLRIREGDPSQTTLTPWEKFCFGMLDLAKRRGW